MYVARNAYPTTGGKQAQFALYSSSSSSDMHTEAINNKCGQYDGDASAYWCPDEHGNVVTPCGNVYDGNAQCSCEVCYDYYLTLLAHDENSHQSADSHTDGTAGEDEHPCSPETYSGASVVDSDASDDEHCHYYDGDDGDDVSYGQFTTPCGIVYDGNAQCSCDICDEHYARMREESDNNFAVRRLQHTFNRVSPTIDLSDESCSGGGDDDYDESADPYSQHQWSDVASDSERRERRRRRRLSSTHFIDLTAEDDDGDQSYSWSDDVDPCF